jgi:hypothetical protein
LTDAAAVPAQADNTQASSSLIASLAAEKSVDPAPVQPQTQPQEQPKAPVATGTWRDRLPEDLRNHDTLSKFDTEEGLAKSYINLERMLGGDKIPVPKDPEDKEAWDRYYAAGGRPADPEKYVINRPAELAEGVTIDEEGEKFLKQFAHQNGFNQRQFDAAYKAFYEHQAKASAAWQKAQADAKAEAERALQLTGNREEVMTLAKATVTQYFDQEAIARLEQAGLGNDPIIIRSLAKIGKDLTGHQVLKGRGGDPVKTGDQVKNDIGAFRQTHNAALMDRTHPEHDMRVKELNAMYQRLYPETAA